MENTQPSTSGPVHTTGLSNRTLVVLTVVGFLVVVLCFILFRFFASDWRQSPPTAKPAAASPSVATADAKTELEIEEARREAARREASLRERRAVARVKMQSVERSGQGVLDLVDSLDAEIARWENDVASLLESERGKLLAASPDHVVTFASLIRQSRPSKADAIRMRNTVEELLAPVRAALQEKESDYEPSVSLDAAIARERIAVEAAAAAYKGPREKIEAMLAVPSQSATMTLAEAIAVAEQQEKERLAQATVDETRRKADEEAARKAAYERTPDKLKPLFGEWKSDKHNFGFRTEGATGIATRTNTPRIKVGDEVLWVDVSSADGTNFTGQVLADDGKKYAVKLTLQNDGSLKMSYKSGGGAFILTRP